MHIRVSLLLVAVITTITAASNSTKAADTKNVTFSKRLSDDSVVALEWKKIAERTTVYFDSDGEKKNLPVEYKETIYRCDLFKEKDGKKEIVWEIPVVIGPFLSGVRPEFIVIDAILVKDRLYVLYSYHDGCLNLKVLEKYSPGQWTCVTCMRLDDKPRSLAVCELVDSTGKIRLVCYDSRSLTPRKECWDIVDNTFRKITQPDDTQ